MSNCHLTFSYRLPGKFIWFLTLTVLGYRYAFHQNHSPELETDRDFFRLRIDGCDDFSVGPRCEQYRGKLNGPATFGISAKSKSVRIEE